MHHDEHLLQLIIDDLAPTQQLLELLKEESLALYGRDMPLLEDILARKQSLIVLLEQHGKKRSEILISLGLPADHDGLAQLASHSSVGDQLLAQSKELNHLLAQCQEANLLNGQSILDLEPNERSVAGTVDPKLTSNTRSLPPPGRNITVAPARSGRSPSWIARDRA